MKCKHGHEYPLYDCADCLAEAVEDRNDTIAELSKQLARQQTLMAAERRRIPLNTQPAKEK